jgi:hypothetical protein
MVTPTFTEPNPPFVGTMSSMSAGTSSGRVMNVYAVPPYGGLRGQIGKWIFGCQSVVTSRTRTRPIVVRIIVSSTVDASVESDLRPSPESDLS